MTPSPKPGHTRLLELDVIAGLSLIASTLKGVLSKTQIDPEQIATLQKANATLTNTMATCRKTGTAFLGIDPDQAIADTRKPKVHEGEFLELLGNPAEADPLDDPDDAKPRAKEPDKEPDFDIPF